MLPTALENLRGGQRKLERQQPRRWQSWLDKARIG
jgi:hypothetical protein